MAPLSSLREVLSSLSRTDAAIQCPTCGTALDVPESNCPTCGAELTVECRDCGETIDADMKACPNCGGKDFEVFRIE